MKTRLDKLSIRCSETYTTDDIIEHLEEELLELLLAIKRVKRSKEPFENFMEEMYDVSTEINTVKKTMELYGILDTDYSYLSTKKLNKFEAMLDKDYPVDNKLKSRYLSFDMVLHTEAAKKFGGQLWQDLDKVS